MLANRIENTNATFLSLIFFTLVFNVSFVKASENLIFSSLEGAYTQKLSEAVLKKAYSTIGVDFDVDWLPPKRSLMIANSGFTDGELSRITTTLKNYPNLLQVKVPVNFIEGVVFTKRKTISVAGWQSLQPYLIGINKGTIFAERGTKGMNVQSVSSFTSLFKMLDKDRVDLVVAPKVIGLYHIAKNNLEGIVINKPYLVRLSLYHFLHKKHASLVPKLEKALKEMQKNGEIEAIRANFINELQSGYIDLM